MYVCMYAPARLLRTRAPHLVDGGEHLLAEFRLDLAVNFSADRGVHVLQLLVPAHPVPRLFLYVCDM
jgi:hypothetical protein